MPDSLTLQKVLSHPRVKGKSPLDQVLIVQKMWLDKKLQLPPEWEEMIASLPVPGTRKARARVEVQKAIHARDALLGQTPPPTLNEALHKPMEAMPPTTDVGPVTTPLQKPLAKQSTQTRLGK